MFMERFARPRCGRPRAWRCFRFLARTYRLLDKVTDEKPDEEGLGALHKCIAKVTEEANRMRFNTAISAMMELTNVHEDGRRVARNLRTVRVDVVAVRAALERRDGASRSRRFQLAK